jgi:hypothetical protein
VSLVGGWVVVVRGGDLLALVQEDFYDLQVS